MKSLLKFTALLFAISFIQTSVQAQSMSKKYKTVVVELTINAPAEKVWAAMVGDYGNISNFSPYIYSSNYVNGSLQGKQGAERKCFFNSKGSQWSHERLTMVNNEKMVAHNAVIDGKKLPLNFDNSRAIYSVKDNGDGTSVARYEFQYRTKPAFLGGLVKGGFKKQMSGTLVGLKHYIETGERVTPENGRYKEIKDKYPKAKVVS